MGQTPQIEKPDEERKIIRNYLDEDTLDDEYKRAMNGFFGKKDKKGDSPDMSKAKLRNKSTSNISANGLSQISSGSQHSMGGGYTSTLAPG
jgi:hypothetical protein